MLTKPPRAGQSPPVRLRAELPTLRSQRRPVPLVGTPHHRKLCNLRPWADWRWVPQGSRFRGGNEHDGTTGPPISIADVGGCSHQPIHLASLRKSACAGADFCGVVYIRRQGRWEISRGPFVSWQGGRLL